MRRLILAAALLPLAAPAIAQDRVSDTEYDLAHMAHTLGDPARQEALARALGTVTEVLLDLPLAPIIAPIAEAAGEDPRNVDPDTTLRRMSPGVDDASRQIARELPRALGTMASMSGAFAGLIPQLRDAADRVRDAMPPLDH